MKTLTVIDTFGFFFRNYYALPYLKSKSGFPTGLLTGFINFIATLNKEHDTDYLLFALDSKEKTWRKELDPNYKANRPKPPEDLTTQLPVAISWIKEMGFKQIEKPGYEADDVVASIVKYAKANDIKVKIVSHDKDLYQLIDDGKVVMYDPVKKVEIDEAQCLVKYGVAPKYIVDYLAIVGDAADNIPGVKGIGAKGAKTLIEEFGTLEEIYENIESIRNARTQKLLNESRENAFLSKELAELHHELIETCDLKEFTFPKENPILNIADELLKYDMNALLKRAGASYDKNQQTEEKPTNQFEAILLDTKEKLLSVIDAIAPNSIVAFDTETDSLDSRKANIIGFSFATEESKAYYVPIAHSYLGVGDQVSKEDAFAALQTLMKHKVVGQNLKYDLAILYNNFTFEPIEIYADTMIISWLLDPSLSAGLDNMAKRYFSHEMVKFKDVVKKGENFSHVALEEASGYAAEDAWMTLKLYHYLSSKLSQELMDEASKVEYPFVNTLLNIEAEGIKIDIDFLGTLLNKANKTIETLTKEIYQLSGTEFNINSTQQLGVILFENLGLKAGKKTKTGYSTDEKVLTGLLDAHEIIPKLLEYREIYKLRSTYIDPLLKLANKEENHRIYTSFLQTGTATGRLSSKNPNLQNIPVRTELGREIRQGFIAKEGYILVGIDYSQIELRLLAHFSQDGALTDAFKNDKDIHLETAIKIFGETDATNKRSIAKSINFGLLYGMGARKLAQTIDVTQKEAKSYIESYFASFPTVKSYLEQIQESAKEKGYVETLLGRRRMFDYENANAFIKASFERESVNTVFQGSAADLMKLSMNEIEKRLDKSKGKMLLQIHDELIFEVKEQEAQNFATEAKTIMEEIYDLNIPLRCSVSIAKHWGGLK
ncbi:MAG: DNA polymerase I [Epsilonproteobacteria bacterium]|nr:DNA polymerase I [Campylobacterota bacterium]